MPLKHQLFASGIQNDADGARFILSNRRLTALKSHAVHFGRVRFPLDIKILLFVSGGVVESRGPDGADSAQQGCYAQFAHQRCSRQLTHMAAAHQTAARDRSWLLHVPDQHEPHEKAIGVHRCSW